MSIQKTPIHSFHVAAPARMIEFHGWEMPLSYKSVIDEHHKVRQSCGIFDVSHMGQVFVKGSRARDFLQFVTMNNIDKLKIHDAQYSAMLYENGGFVDDIIVYRLGEDSYLLCINAANTSKDVAWLEQQNKAFKAEVFNASPEWSQIAIQGPESDQVIDCMPFAKKARSLRFMQIAEFEFENQTCYIGRSGYTGEFGYEIYAPNKAGAVLWSLLFTAGASPIGLGARDTLRLEAGLLLYGNDMDESVNPLEAGVSWAIDFECGDFIGKKALQEYAARSATDKRRLVCFKLDDKGVARPDMAVFHENQLVGRVTSASVLPSLNSSGGFALIKSTVPPGAAIEIDIRGKRKLAHLDKRPLYSTKTRAKPAS